MSFNQFKHFIKKKYWKVIPKKHFMDNQRSDKEMECLQFGIRAVQLKTPRPEKLFFR